MIEKQRTTPIGKREDAGAAKAQNPDAHRDFAEDPVSKDFDRSEEQKRAFQMPGERDPRVEASQKADPPPQGGLKDHLDETAAGRPPGQT